MAKHKLDELLAKSQSRIANAKAERPYAATSPKVATPEGVDRDTIIVERDKIDANPNQPRRYFNEEDLKSLGESLRRDGQLQALVVRPHPLRQGRYQLVSGERRWRAAGQKYGDVERLRVTVRELTDEQVLRLGLIENVQRSDLMALEKARALAQLRISPRGEKTLFELEEETGLKKSQIQRLLSLLDLPEPLQNRFDKLNLNEKHGRALLLLNDDRRAQNQLMRSIEEGEMSGNEALRVAESLKKTEPPVAPPTSGPSTWTSQTPAASTSATPATAGSGMVTSGGDNSAANRPGVEVGQTVSRETKATPEDFSSKRAEASSHLFAAAHILESLQMPDAARRVREINDEMF